jgi:beta-glucanase (GH16 family)
MAALFVAPLIIALTLCPAVAYAQPSGGCTGVADIVIGSTTYVPTWCQEFNGAQGSPDTSVWKFDLGGGGWGNGEAEIYCGPPGYSGNPSQCPTTFSTTTNPTYIDGSGHLVIQAINEGGNWLSGRMNTEGLENFTYGILVASILLPNTTNQGLWPAWWTLGSDITTVPWPGCGEYDIMEDWSPQVDNGEGTTGDISTAHTTKTGGSGVGGRYTFPSGEAGNTAYHEYGVIWQANELQTYVDNPSSPFLTITPSSLPSGDTWPFNQSMFVIMNVAVGGTLGGSDANLTSPQVMSVDYVRWYTASTGTAPAAPTNLTATAVSSSQINLSWTASTTSGVTYTVLRGGTSIATGVTGTTYSDTGLAASTQYSYTVEAVDSGGTSPASNTATATTLAASCTTVPSAPTGLAAAAISSSAIGLNWTAVTPPANCTISSYSVYGSTTSGFTPGSGNLIASGVTSVSYTNSGLAASTTYYYKVEAVDADGTSAASAQASATTQATGTGPTYVVAISAGGPAASPFAADEDYAGGTASSTTATVTTTGVTNPAPESVYQHQRFGNFTYTIPGLTAGTSYPVVLYFDEFYWTAAGKRVFNVSINGTQVLTNFDIFAAAGGEDKAIDETFTATANSSGQIVITFTTVTDNAEINGIAVLAPSGGSCSAVPSAPTGLVATASSSSSIGLTWTAVTPPANCTISGYNVYRSTTSGFTPGSGNLVASGVTTASYSNTGLAASTTYYFIVEALDSYGSSAASAQASATTPAAGTYLIAISAGGPAASPFVADEDYAGGTASSTTATVTTTGVTNPAPESVYQHQRFGNFTYTLPGFTAGSNHTVVLYFDEFYWTAAGKRVFNVSINGTQVLTNFDIFAAAGGEDKAIDETYTATANSSGQIVITFTTVTDNAEINGISVQ